MWTDKRKSIAQKLDSLGDEFRLAMRAGWLAYICSVYGEEGAPDVGVIEGEDTLVVDDWVYAAAGCYEHSSAVMDDATSQ